MLRASSLRLAGAAALLFAAAPAFATDTPQANQAASAPSDQAADTAAAPAEDGKPKKERKICRKMDTSDSRLGAQRMCMTAEQWKHAQY